MPPTHPERGLGHAPQAKDLSHMTEGLGGALVPPPAQAGPRPKRRKPGQLLTIFSVPPSPFLKQVKGYREARDSLHRRICIDDDTGKRVPCARVTQAPPVGGKPFPSLTERLGDSLEEMIANGEDITPQSLLTLGEAILKLKAENIGRLRQRLGMDKGRGPKSRKVNEIVEEVKRRIAEGKAEEEKETASLADEARGVADPLGEVDPELAGLNDLIADPGIGEDEGVDLTQPLREVDPELAEYLEAVGGLAAYAAEAGPQDDEIDFGEPVVADESSGIDLTKPVLASTGDEDDEWLDLPEPSEEEKEFVRQQEEREKELDRKLAQEYADDDGIVFHVPGQKSEAAQRLAGLTQEDIDKSAQSFKMFRPHRNLTIHGMDIGTLDVGGQKLFYKGGMSPESSAREVDTSDLLGMVGLRAPASMKAGVRGFGEGIASEWVEGKTVVEGFSQGLGINVTGLSKALKDPAEFDKMALMSFMLSLNDRHDNNFMVSDDGHLVSIDHEFSLGTAWDGAKATHQKDPGPGAVMNAHRPMLYRYGSERDTARMDPKAVREIAKAADDVAEEAARRQPWYGPIAKRHAEILKEFAASGRYTLRNLEKLTLDRWQKDNA